MPDSPIVQLPKAQVQGPKQQRRPLPGICVLVSVPFSATAEGLTYRELDASLFVLPHFDGMSQVV